MRAVRALALVAVTALLSGLALLPAASGAGAATGLHFSSFPTRVLAGGEASVAVTGPHTNDRCSLVVAYPGGSAQRAPATRVTGPRPLAWTWTVPGTAKSGAAHVTVSCRSAGRISRRLVVVGKVQPPRVDVVKQGFSQRTKYSNTAVSYGVVLANRSTTYDALDVSVLVNFVGANGALVGSATTVVKSIPARSQYALGKSATSVDGPVTVARLEVVIQVGSGQPAIKAPQPAVLNGTIAPGTSDPKWIGSVRGELTNEASALIIKSAAVSVVVLNAAGDIVGGGSGSAYGTLPPGAREFVRLTTGLDSILMTDAASLQFSVEPSYAAE
jgi:hypothetical protein